jgi:hypothetical protein
MDETRRFAICIQRSDDTDLLRVYPVIDDADAEQTGMLRIIDESGEDYLHATARFIVVTVPSVEAHALLQAMEAPATSHR